MFGASLLLTGLTREEACIRGPRMGNVAVTAAGVNAGCAEPARGASGRVNSRAVSPEVPRVLVVRGTKYGEAWMSGGIGSVRRDVTDDRIGPVDIPSQRTAADAYRVSDDQLHRARMVVARNSADQEDLRQLLDMLGLISPNPDQPPPVSR